MPSRNVKTLINSPLKTYVDCIRIFQDTKESTWRVSVCGNTCLVRECGEGNETTFALVFHSTKIIRYYRDGRISLNSGGYKTATTKHRMNQFSRVGVGQTKGEWFVYLPMNYATTGKMFDWDHPLPFVDNDILNIDDKVVDND